jgi:DNA mismatch endonuclease (patch repair protein)
MPAKKEKSSVPRYEGFRPRDVAASKVGAGNRRQNTTPEMLLRKALWRRGHRYRVQSSKLPGRPDIVLARYRVIVFCDGDFWHGRNWRQRKKKLSGGWNAEYWVAKIGRNRTRDRVVNRTLRMIGWRVIRVWESDVKRDPDQVAEKISKLLEASQRGGKPLRAH